MRSTLLLTLVTAALLAGCGPPTTTAASDGAAVEFTTYEDAFATDWYDGLAELASYELTYPRYGEQRSGGTAVAITVSEHFHGDLMVKAEQATDRTLPMLKLNLIQDFQTGLYDYNTMTSVFVSLTDHDHLKTGRVAKTSYGSQEWCGQVYQQATMRPDGLQLDMHSYFESEADDTRTIDDERDGFWEDALWLWARGLAGPAVDQGGSVEIPLLRSLETSRMHHIPVVWDRATLSRPEGQTEIEVPAGRFTTHSAEVSIRRESERQVYRFWVEVEPPHRMIRWERDDGFRADFVASVEKPYWTLQRTVDERGLAELGLRPAPPPKR